MKYLSLSLSSQRQTPVIKIVYYKATLSYGVILTIISWLLCKILLIMRLRVGV